MRWLAATITFLLGLVSGWLVSTLPVVEERSAYLSKKQDLPTILHPCPPSPPDPEIAQELSALVVAQQRALALQHEIDDLIGPPRDFPDDLDPGWRPENAEATVVADLAGSGFELLELRCETFPCLAVLQTADWIDGSLAILGMDPGLATQRIGTDSGWIVTVPLMPSPDPTDTRWIRQINHRLDLIGEEVLLQWR